MGDPKAKNTEQERAVAALGDRNLVLTGFMGTGKSTVGRVLADVLRWQFVDTDDLIEEMAGAPIAELFAARGEEAFRDLETEVAGGLGELHHCVIATGGGFVLRPENSRAAERAGVLVLLMATPEQIWHRVKDSKHRPLLAAEDPQTKIKELLKQRQPAYDAVKLKIDTNAKTPQAIASDVLGAIARL